MPRKRDVPFFGVWHEAWTACCRYHNIPPNPEIEQDACSAAAKDSYYHPNKEIPDNDGDSSRAEQ